MAKLFANSGDPDLTLRWLNKSIWLPDDVWKVQSEYQTVQILTQLPQNKSEERLGRTTTFV